MSDNSVIRKRIFEIIEDENIHAFNRLVDVLDSRNTMYTDYVVRHVDFFRNYLNDRNRFYVSPQLKELIG